MEEVDERAFLFRGKRGANVHHFTLGATGVYEDLLGALYRLKRPGRPLGVGCFFDDLLPDGRWKEAMIAVACSQHSTSHS